MEKVKKIAFKVFRLFYVASWTTLICFAAFFAWSIYLTSQGIVINA